jgi:hypothetical protein
VRSELDETGSGSYPKNGFGIGGVESSGYIYKGQTKQWKHQNN